MKRKSLLLGVLLLSLFSASNVYANIIFSKNSGLWHHSSTWEGGVVPTAGDHVIINGDIVTFAESSGNVSINKLDIFNSGNAPAGLVLTGNKTFEVVGDVLMLSTSINDLLLKTEDTSVLSVLGSLTIERKAGNSFEESVKLYIKDASSVSVGTYFTYNYDDASLYENSKEIRIENDGKLFVGSDMNLVSRGGHSFEMDIWYNGELEVNGNLVLEMLGGVTMDLDLYSIGPVGSRIQVNGNLDMINHAGQGGLALGRGSNNGQITIEGNTNIESKEVSYNTTFKAEGPSAVFETKKDINLSAFGNGNTRLVAFNGSTLKLGGTINRAWNGFGILEMDATSTLELNGTGPQTIPPTRLLSEVLDSLYISNISFNNTSGEPITLTGCMYVNDYLDLTGGILKTTHKNILVIGENASIDPGSKTSYVDGPIQKIGGTNGLPFIFPTGHNGVYAPIEISSITGSTTFTGSHSIYTAEYRRGDPPPFGENFAATQIESITDNQYWTLNNNGGTEPISVSLHWSDPAELGISNVDSLVVASYNSSTNTWTNHGQQDVSGSTATDSPGYVMGMEGDPPPFGENLAFTIGSTDIGSLPVELMEFEAVQEVDEVYLQWMTVSEVNASHFVVERSVDGIDFESMTTVNCRGGEELKSTYSAKDTKPYYGTNFYRLKIVDRDGSYEYPPVKVAKFEVIPVVSLYPNPVSEFLNLEVGGEADGEGTIEIYDRGGQLLYRGDVSFENGNFQASSNELNVNSPGTYIIRIKIDQQEQVLKFIKLK